MWSGYEGGLKFYKIINLMQRDPLRSSISIDQLTDFEIYRYGLYSLPKVDKEEEDTYLDRDSHEAFQKYMEVPLSVKMKSGDVMLRIGGVVFIGLGSITTMEAYFMN